MAERDTIAALATACAPAALAVVRVSGPQSFVVTERCMKSGERFGRLPPRQVALFTLVNPLSGAAVDQVTVVKYYAPASYTGEEMVEVTCHGGHIVTEKILQALLAAGARYAHRGEFTRRALMNRKMGLLEAEAVNALIMSATEAQHQAALAACRGVAGREIGRLRERIADALAAVEARLEFPEEADVATIDGGQIQNSVGELARWVAGQLASRRKMKGLDRGIMVAIVGEPNAGKSTLFNRLLGEERSLVHWQSGTTRDWVSERAVVGDVQVTLIDTAGIGEAGHEVEAMGIERSWEHVREADILLWVTVADRAISLVEEKLLRVRAGRPLVCVVNKADLGDAEGKSGVLEARGLSVVVGSGKTGVGMGEVYRTLERVVRGLGPSVGEATVVLNDRQEAALAEAGTALELAVAEWGRGEEIVAQYLREAAAAVEDLAGRMPSEDVLDRIFSRFCIGK